MTVHAKAGGRVRIPGQYLIRPIIREDNAGIARVIGQVMPEFGAKGPGFALSDSEVTDMYSAYSKPRCSYFVVVAGTQVVGAGGVAPLEGGDADTCELRKMYFLPELRGLGYGQEMMERCLTAARTHGFTHCYLETLQGMLQARALYEKNGFKPLAKPLGGTGHFGCDVWYAKKL